jgi:hypothetical protein
VDETSLVVNEEVLLKEKVYGRTDNDRTPDEKRSQKLTMSLCER